MDRFQKAPVNPDGKTHAKDPKGRVGALHNKMSGSLESFARPDSKAVELLFVPKDLQTRDPSLMCEISLGHFGLDGIFVEVGEGHPSVFEARYTDDNFNRLLHGFSWLSDLSAAGEHEARTEAQRLTFLWIERYANAEGIASEPLVMARRIVSFLANGPLILKGVGKKKAWRFMRTLTRQVQLAHGAQKEMPPGLDRLLVLSALVLAGLCLSQHDKLLARVQPLFLYELEVQIFKDGGHVSRNPDALTQILFDIIPLKEGFKSRGQELPKELDRAIKRMLPMIRFFRLGDSSLARFNGVSTTPTDALATLLAYDERNRPFDAYAGDSHYCRVQDGPMTLLCDVGGPPPDTAARFAHAGCLSLEFSIRHFALVVNSGSFQGEDECWQKFARSTAAHSALTIDDHSSGGFDENGLLAGPYDVDVTRADLSGLEVAHHGYEKQFGFIHRRLLDLTHQGLRLSGVDRLEGAGLEGETSFCIRFHLHPLIEVARSDDDNVLLTLPDGEIWRFHARGAKMDLQDSVYLAYKQGPRPSHQITLSGSARSGAQVDWLFEQYRPRPEEK